MNYKTNIYGAIGLASTIGKHSFALGQVASNGGQKVFHFIREDIIEVDLAITGKVFEKLENASKWSAKKCKWAEIKSQEWETWAQEKYKQAQAQEKLNEDWKDNVNPEVPTLKKIVSEKLLSAKEKTVKGLKKIEEKYFPQTKLETPEKANYRPNCLRFWGF